MNLSNLTDRALARARQLAYQAWQEAEDRATDPQLSPTSQHRARKHARAAKKRLARLRAEAAKRTRRQHGGGLCR